MEFGVLKGRAYASLGVLWGFRLLPAWAFKLRFRIVLVATRISHFENKTHRSMKRAPAVFTLLILNNAGLGDGNETGLNVTQAFWFAVKSLSAHDE